MKTRRRQLIATIALSLGAWGADGGIVSVGQ